MRQSSNDCYKRLYCMAGESKWTQCKRYQVSQQLGKCGDFVMPNSPASIEEIEEKMKKKNLI